MKIPFVIVDVFAERRFSGNQLAVISCNSDLSREQMQDIAREMHFSETTFINPSKMKDTHYPVRIFTPEHEVPFAGHPVLGTAFVIREMIMKHPGETLILGLQVGEVQVTYSHEIGKPSVYWMKQPAPIFGRTFDKADVAASLCISEDTIDTRFPIEEVSTGLPFIIVPLISLKAVQSARLNTELHTSLITDSEAKAIFFFSSETINPENKIHARMFGPYYGVLEDPATGSASGCLTAYLVKHGYFKKKPDNILIEQGYEIHRPSLIRCRAEMVSGRINIEVGGSVFLVATGELILT